MFWQIVLLVVASNLDDLAVGFSLGMKWLIPWKVIATIAVFSGLTMAIGLFFGGLTSGFFPDYVLIYASSLVFFLIGLWFLWDAKKSKNEKSEEKSFDLGWKAAIVLGIALGIDSLAVGFSGGLVGYPIVATSALAFITSLIFIWGGSRFGHLVALKVFKDYAGWISGLLFILLALIILVI
ncbi:hypothetical protein BTR23_08775 [Alkalihalophilus pseudofirmus]|nr:hypothetical protein BTR23_08775 [Alkalihalophilus pseudofirmus]